VSERTQAERTLRAISSSRPAAANSGNNAVQPLRKVQAAGSGDPIQPS
jgi:hypothetical protein